MLVGLLLLSAGGVIVTLYPLCQFWKCHTLGGSVPESVLGCLQRGKQTTPPPRTPDP